MDVEELVLELENIGAIKFGEFKLKSGLMSPVYFDLRVIVSYPKLLDSVAQIMLNEVQSVKKSSSLVCGVPYTALPIATMMSVKGNLPMVVRRKEAKDYGTKKMVEGKWEVGQDCIIVEDVITSGGSVKETAQLLRDHQMQVSTCVVLLDREQGGRQNLTAAGINVISIFPITRVLDILLSRGRVTSSTCEAVRAFINNNQTHNTLAGKTNGTTPGGQSPSYMSFKSRLQHTTNPVNKRLLEIMIKKESNLCVAVDKIKSADVLDLVEKVGKSVAVVKLHSDIVQDWSKQTQDELIRMSKENDFLLFEDRKLADIGNTVKHQSASISEWADLLTVHGLPGPGLLQGVKDGCMSTGKTLGVLLVAEMSNAGNLFTSEFTQAVVNMGEKEEWAHTLSGFIAQSRVSQKPGMLQLTPGVHMAEASDKGDQRYTSPLQAVTEKGADLVIVGRGICADDSPGLKAEEYRQEAWKAYISTIQE
eukprot:TRINITY_DN8938_c0_g1_i1.p1 TRINITY_DN8938_c0_g1~~TRINITY_DN8938_c0_g1_i1.p1  ORF type:complete len:477 (-),score=123.45 TRINITY_DN8938_c0_g1_i1:714-2144(-)